MPASPILPSPLERALPGGQILFAVAVAGLGVQCLLLLQPVPALEPLPAGLPGEGLWSALTGVLLLGAGAGLAARWRQRTAALILAGLLGSWITLLLAPRLLAAPANGGLWTGLLETLALASAAWSLRDHDRSDAFARRHARLGRMIFGATLLGFGVLHLIYWRYVSSVIPGWIPGPLFWTYATAGAFFAAGSALLTGVLARPAAAWTGLMFLLWVGLLHLPRALAATQGARREWASLLIALAMGGGAWVHARRAPGGAGSPP